MIEEIIPKIKNKQIILFGEIHGTKEIPELLSGFFEEISKKEDFDVGLEIPDEFQGQIDSYMNSGDYSILKNILFFSKEECTDGRNSLEYASLIRSLYNLNKNIKIYCISPSSAENQEEMEEGIANKILEKANNKKIFAIMGNIHSSKREIYFLGQKIIPAGFLVFEKMKEKMITILLTAEEGKFFNNEIKEVISSKGDEFEENFDYVLRLKKVTPCSFL
jgi:hypothetical protein